MERDVELDLLLTGPFSVEAVSKLNKDLKKAAATLNREEARYLVDGYYMIQEYRKAMGNQIRALGESGEPNDFFNWLFNNVEVLEKNIKSALQAYAGGDPVGQWAMSIMGIGPVIAAGLLAHIDIHKAPTVGHIWRFAGLDPTVEWLGKDKAKTIVDDVMGKEKSVTPEHIGSISARVNRRAENLMSSAEDEDGKISKADLVKAVSMRPWNSDLKTLCWKIGECFVKVSNNEKDVYGKYYRARKAYETALNEAGTYAKQAEDKLTRYNIGKDTEAYKWYAKGMLPPAHINERAKRYAVKLFLAHWHEMAYKLVLKQEPPKPYAISILGHAHQITPPNKDMLFGVAGK